MGPVAFSLCQKPVIGLLMWLTSMCAFPPLIKATPVSLAAPGKILSEPFKVRVDKRYSFHLNFQFSSQQARLADEIVGSTYSSHCMGDINYMAIPQAERAGLGRPIPFRVLIRKRADNAVTFDKVFNSLCESSSSTTNKSREIGYAQLVEGEYILELYNIEPQPGLEHIITRFSLTPGRSK